MLRNMREIFVHEIKIQELGKYKYTKVPPKSCYRGVSFKSKLYKYLGNKPAPLLPIYNSRELRKYKYTMVP